MFLIKHEAVRATSFGVWPFFLAAIHYNATQRTKKMSEENETTCGASGCEGIPDHVVDMIAERAAQRALEHVYMEVGKSIVTKLFWLAGIVTVSLLLFMAGKGIIEVKM